MKKAFILQILLLVFTVRVFAQHDSIVFNNGNFIVGEVKTMDRNILKVETDYSDADFAVEWNGIKEIYTKTVFLITLTDGTRLNGTLKSAEPGKIRVKTDKGETVTVNISDVVILNDIAQGFWNQINASVDFGFDLTKANNFRQLSIRSNIGYIANRWQLDGTYNIMNSSRDEVDDIKNTDGGATFKYFLPKDWYPLVSLNFLSNTEQQIDLRTTGKLGMGKYIIHTNKSYWGFSLGGNYNSEKYMDASTPDRKSWEGFLGTELNMFNIGDLNLLTQLIAYPSFTESGRWRTDFKFDAKYDLPLDFYIKLGYTLYFDNRPAAGSSKTDYVFHSGLGWEW